MLQGWKKSSQQFGQHTQHMQQTTTYASSSSLHKLGIENLIVASSLTNVASPVGLKSS